MRNFDTHILFPCIQTLKYIFSCLQSSSAGKKKYTNAFVDIQFEKTKVKAVLCPETLCGVACADQRERLKMTVCCTTNSTSEGQAQTLAWMFGSEGCNYLGTMWKCCNYKANVWSAFIARRSANLNETHSLSGTSKKLGQMSTGSTLKRVYLQRLRGR